MASSASVSGNAFPFAVVTVGVLLQRAVRKITGVRERAIVLFSRLNQTVRDA
jgi:hypothetical protein